MTAVSRPISRGDVGLVVVVALATMLAGCAAARRVPELAVEHANEAFFYRLPDPLPAGAPGTMIRQVRLLGAPDGSIAWRVLYHSRDVLGHDVAVSGTVIAPTTPGPHPVVAWAHPTTGAAKRCAPSVGVDPFVLIEGLTNLIKAGYVVAATDYPGMGADGPQSYLIGTTEGNSVLDSARAARTITQAHASNDLLLWGHSQGGQAALFAAHAAPTYAPDLHLLGVAVAAPAVELGSLLRDDITDDSGVTLGSYAFNAYFSVYGPSVPGTQLTSLLTPAGAAATPAMAKLCLFGQHGELHKIATPLVGHYLAADPEQVEPWKTWLADNTPPASGYSTPLFVAQGLADKLVNPTTTTQFVGQLCAQGQQVHYLPVPQASHGIIALRALPTLLPWFADLVAGRAVGSTCGP